MQRISFESTHFLVKYDKQKSHRLSLTPTTYVKKGSMHYQVPYLYIVK
jgi:hypothetical protein